MKIRKECIERRAVIEAYAKYDCSKTRRPTPIFETWDWSHADSIDREMKGASLKAGIPAGYMLWDEVEISLSDLRESAVDVNIFPGKSRMLGLLEAKGELVGWRPDRRTCWYDDITRGQVFDEHAPMLLRAAVSSEFPASWYVEDGSGRAVAFVANQRLFNSSQTLAIGFLARKPDICSSFMKSKFRELLC